MKLSHHALAEGNQSTSLLQGQYHLATHICVHLPEVLREHSGYFVYNAVEMKGVPCWTQAGCYRPLSGLVGSPPSELGRCVGTPWTLDKAFLKQSDVSAWHKRVGVQAILHEPGVAERLASFYCSAESRLHTNKEVAAQISNVPARDLEPVLSMVATTLVELDRASRLHLEGQLVASSCKLICYLYLAKYDETSMRVRSSHVLEQLLGGPHTRGPHTRASGQHQHPQPVHMV